MRLRNPTTCAQGISGASFCASALKARADSPITIRYMATAALVRLSLKNESSSKPTRKLSMYPMAVSISNRSAALRSGIDRFGESVPADDPVSKRGVRDHLNLGPQLRAEFFLDAEQVKAQRL